LANQFLEKPMSVSDALRLTHQVCGALEAAHQVGVVHRDIKPDNIFVTEREGAVFAKVLDFGVAKLSRSLDQMPVVSATQQGMIIGTPTYMSPEQAAGLDLDHRTDIYSVGVVLYEALAGKPPFTSTSFGNLMVEIITQKAPNLARKTPSGEPISPALAALVRRCMAKKLEERPQSMAELATEIERIRSGKGSAATAATWAWRIAAASAVVGVLAVGAHRLTAPSAAADAPRSAPAHAVAVPMEPVAPAPAPTPAPPPALALPATVDLKITSIPPGAEVTREDTGAVWGVTPFTVTVPRATQDLRVAIKLGGYLAEESSLSLDKDAVLTVALQAAPAAPAPSAPAKAHKKAVSHDGDIDPFAP
jgi:serine/threonine-protein kinase